MTETSKADESLEKLRGRIEGLEEAIDLAEVDSWGFVDIVLIQERLNVLRLEESRRRKATP